MAEPHARNIIETPTKFCVIIRAIQKRKEQDSVIYIIIARDRSSYITSDIVESFV